MNITNTNAPIIVGVDHGFGNIKTAHACFQTGVSSYDKEPTFKSNLLTYDGRYYVVGVSSQVKCTKTRHKVYQ